MARGHGRLLSSIWTDSDFTNLPCEAQRLYMLLLSQADLTHAGTLPLAVRRWARMAPDSTEDGVRDAIAILSDRRFVVVDEDTEELLVRSLIRRDAVAENWKVFCSAAGDIRAVMSDRLRLELRAELARLTDVSDRVRTVRDALLDELPDDDKTLPASTKSNSGRGILSCDSDEIQPGKGHPLARAAPTPTPTPTPTFGREPRKRGQRLPDDWTPSPDLIAWQRSEGIGDLVARRELAKFRDYWAAKPGQGGVKLDWDGTWRNWLRRATEPNRPSVPANRAALDPEWQYNL